MIKAKIVRTDVIVHVKATNDLRSTRNVPHSEGDILCRELGISEMNSFSNETKSKSSNRLGYQKQSLDMDCMCAWECVEFGQDSSRDANATKGNKSPIV